MDWKAIFTNAGKEHIEERIESGFSKLDIRELASINKILGTLILMLAGMNETLRSVAINLFAGMIANNKHVPREIRATLPSILRALPPGLERALVEQKLSPDDLKQQLVDLWDNKAVPVLEDDTKACTGPNESDHIHMVSGCPAAAKQNSYTNSLEYMFQHFRWRTPCPNCFGDVWQNGWTVQTVQAPEPTTEPTLVNITPEQARAIGLVEAMLDLRRSEVINRPDGVNQLTVAMRKGLLAYPQALALLPAIDAKVCTDAEVAIENLRKVRDQGQVDKEDLGHAKKTLRAFSAKEADVKTAEANLKAKTDAKDKAYAVLRRSVSYKGFGKPSTAAQSAFAGPLGEFNTAFRELEDAKQALDVLDKSSLDWARHVEAQAARNGSYGHAEVEAHRKVIYDLLVKYQPYLATLRTIGTQEFNWWEKYGLAIIDEVDDRVTDTQRIAMRRVLNSLVNADTPTRVMAIVKLYALRSLYGTLGIYAVIAGANALLLLVAVAIFVPSIAYLFVLGPMLAALVTMGETATSVNQVLIYAGFVTLLISIGLTLAVSIMMPLLDKMNNFLSGILHSVDPRNAGAFVNFIVTSVLALVKDKEWAEKLKLEKIGHESKPSRFFSDISSTIGIAAFIVGVLAVVHIAVLAPWWSGLFCTFMCLVILLRVYTTKRFSGRIPDPKLTLDAINAVELIDLLTKVGGVLFLMCSVVVLGVGTVNVTVALVMKTIAGIILGLSGLALALMLLGKNKRLDGSSRSNIGLASVMLIATGFMLTMFSGTALAEETYAWAQKKHPEYFQDYSSEYTGENKGARGEVPCDRFPNHSSCR